MLNPHVGCNSSGTQQFTFRLDPTGNKDIDGLLEAVHKDRIGDIKKWLNEHDKTINCSSNNGITPLMLAAREGSPKVFEIILKNSTKENIHKVDATGRNALHYACASNCFKRVELLYAVHKLEITKDGVGYCAAEYAAKNAKEIHDLLGKVTQAYLDREGILLRKIYEKAGGDLAKMNELRVEYGLKGNFKATPVDEFKEKYGGSVTKVSQRTLAEIKKEAKKNLNECRAEIVEHFIANPPKSLQEAIGYVWEKYGVKTSADSMQKLLDYADKKRLEKQEKKLAQNL